MTACILQLLDNYVQTNYSPLLAVLHPCFRLEIQFIEFIVLDFLLDSLLQEVVDRFILFEYILNEELVLLIKLAKLAAYCMIKVIGDEFQRGLLIEV
jgi:hypothetical protein